MKVFSEWLNNLPYAVLNAWSVKYFSVKLEDVGVGSLFLFRSAAELTVSEDARPPSAKLKTCL